MTMTESQTTPAEKAKQARERVDELRAERDRALGELARQQHEAPWASGHASAEAEVQRLHRALSIARTAADAADFRAKHGPRPEEPSSTTTDDELGALEAAHAAASFDAANAEGDVREVAEDRLAVLEARLDEYHRSQRRAAAASAEAARRDQATAAEEAEAAKVTARTELAALARERLEVSGQVESHLAELAADLGSWYALTQRLRNASRRSGQVLGSGDERSLAATLAAVLTAAGVRGLPHTAGDAHLRPWSDQETDWLGALVPNVEAR